MKRKLSILLLLVMIVNMFSAFCAVAQDSENSAKSASALTYTIENGEVTITACDKNFEGEMVIPSTIEGYPVTAIGKEAFDSCSAITSIEIPDSVTSIGSNAFKYCTDLTSVKLSENLTKISPQMFATVTVYQVLKFLTV